MNDESYFTTDDNEWQVKYYYDHPSTSVDNSVKYIAKTKFPQKIMPWLTISECEMSEPHFFRSGLGVTEEVYKTNCLPKVATFIHKLHRNKNVVFWPDLASSHYTKSSIDQMRRLGIPFISKEQNSPNVPQLRSIEDFWANLKRRQQLQTKKSGLSGEKIFWSWNTFGHQLFQQLSNMYQVVAVKHIKTA